jgi:hypothetical protein
METREILLKAEKGTLSWERIDGVKILSRQAVGTTRSSPLAVRCSRSPWSTTCLRWCGPRSRSSISTSKRWDAPRSRYARLTSGDLQFAAPRWADRGRDLDHLVVVGVVRFRLFLDRQHLAAGVHFEHAVALRIRHDIAENRRSFGARRHLGHQLRQPVAVEDVVAADQRDTTRCCGRWG